ncbi:MAG: nitrous oxide reductase accessory protein NosL [Campylobacterota bacterium]|nr:nitrous oxide reductase accessory protein NosL [Campylobacterota bacterium]
MRKLMISLLTVCTMLVAINTSAMAMGNGQGQQKKMKNPRAVPMAKATILQDGKNKMYCPVCGMTLPMFYKTNHAASHNGKNHQYCSIVCAVEDAVVNNKKLDNFKVVDNSTLKFINSKDAYFVVGSKMPGTMSVVSKYAFGTKEAANKLVAKKGGKVMRFDALYALVEKSQAKDMKATKMRQAKAIKKGGMMYKKMCKKTDKKFASTADAKSFLIKSGICGKIKGKKHQAIALYLNSRK